MARAIGRSRGVRTHMTAGPALSTHAALVGLLCGLDANDILFIDEIHALPRPVVETLYEVMEGRTLSLPITEGVRARTLTLRLPPITIVGATTESHTLPPSLLSRFPLEETVERYSDEELAKIIALDAAHRDRPITEEAALVLARASLGTPRSREGPALPHLRHGVGLGTRVPTPGHRVCSRGPRRRAASGRNIAEPSPNSRPATAPWTARPAALPGLPRRPSAPCWNPTSSPRELVAAG